MAATAQPGAAVRAANRTNGHGVRTRRAWCQFRYLVNPPIIMVRVQVPLVDSCEVVGVMSAVGAFSGNPVEQEY